MEYRTGKCSQCGAEYKIPASFAHNVARCKVCRGVVHVSGGAGASGGGPRREPREREPAPSTRAASSAPPGEAPPAPAPARTPSPAPPQREPVGAPATRAQPAAREPALQVAEARSGLPMPLLVVGAVLVLAAAGLFLFRTKIFGAERAPAGAPETTAPADQ